MEQVIIGVDPHKLSATIEVVDGREKLLGSGRFSTDRAGYAALLKYVESTQLVNDLTYRDSAALDEPPNLAPIKDPETVLGQARTAATITKEQVGGLVVAGLDPAFVQWNSRWGADLAFGRLPNSGDEQRLHGLEFQWFAVLQSRLLAALSR